MTIHSDICAAGLDMSSAHVSAGLVWHDCGNLSLNGKGGLSHVAPPARHGRFQWRKHFGEIPCVIFPWIGVFRQPGARPCIETGLAARNSATPLARSESVRGLNSTPREFGEPSAGAFPEGRRKSPIIKLSNFRITR